MAEPFGQRFSTRGRMSDTMQHDSNGAWVRWTDFDGLYNTKMEQQRRMAEIELDNRALRSRIAELERLNPSAGNETSPGVKHE